MENHKPNPNPNPTPTMAKTLTWKILLYANPLGLLIALLKIAKYSDEIIRTSTAEYYQKLKNNPNHPSENI